MNCELLMRCRRDYFACRILMAYENCTYTAIKYVMLVLKKVFIVRFKSCLHNRNVTRWTMLILPFFNTE